MKDELGIDHFEGRSWNGWHHHTVLTQIAYAYLAFIRFEAKDEEDEDPLPTIPEVRREVVKEIALKIFIDLFGVDISDEYDKGAKRFSEFIAKMA